MPKMGGFVGKRHNAGVDRSMSGQRKRRALPVLDTLSLKQVFLSWEQVWHSFTGLEYYHTFRYNLSLIFHVCTGGKERQEGLHILF